MNEIAVVDRKIPALPEAAMLPTLSRVLSDAVWLVGSQRSPSTLAREEAARMLAAAAAMLGAPKLAHVMNWLKRVNLGASQPISPADMSVRGPIIADALLDLPAGAFTVATARAAILKFKWFPGAAEVAEFLAAEVKSIQHFERGVQSVVRFIDPPPPPPPPTEEERKAIAEIVRGLTGKGRFAAQPPVRTVEEQIAAIRGDVS